MIKRFLLVATAVVVSSSAYADDREEEMFGGSAPTPAKPSATAADIDQTSTYGGRLQLELTGSHLEGEENSEFKTAYRSTADVYYEGKPNKDYKGLLRLRFVDQAQSFSTGGSSVNSTLNQLQIDEALLRWDMKRTVFFTVGKQHLRWGAGKFWNPTDFLASDVKDPFATFDRRLGNYLIKMHMPQEKQGFNHYLVFKVDQNAEVQDQVVAVRSELAFGGQGETALTFQYGGRKGSRIGWDVSAGVGPMDLYGEAAMISNRLVKVYEGDLDFSTGTIPTEKTLDKDGYSKQIVAGFSWSANYTDEDSLTIGAEYLANDIGYDDPELELYAYLSGSARQLYLGKRYMASYLRLPTPFSFNSTTIMLSGLRNLSDKSASERITVSYDLGTGTSFEIFTSACQGSPGELCFAMQPQLRDQIVASPTAPDSLKLLVSSLPTAATRFQLGTSLSIAF